MKKTVVLVLVLIVVFSSLLFSETLDCQQSFELGKVAAKEEHWAWGWYWIGIGLNTLIYGAFFFSDFDARAFNTTLTLINITTFIPAFIFPLRSRVFPSSSEVDLAAIFHI